MTRPATGSPSPSEAAVPSMFGALSGRRTMTDAVYEQLKAAIVELRIPPGAPLREAEIAQGLSVSKTPVREALGRLEQDGLVTLNSFRSATVTDGRLTAEIPGRIDASVREHAQIYEAIERRDPENASRFMRDHIRSVRDDQLRALPEPGAER